MNPKQTIKVFQRSELWIRNTDIVLNSQVRCLVNIYKVISQTLLGQYCRYTVCTVYLIDTLYRVQDGRFAGDPNP